MEEDSVGPGLFDDLNKTDSKVNILIGSRKFMEGWDSFRVSSMGLLNIGQGEGSQIIQLFGRGVRLRGKGYSLKRSAFLRNQTAAPPPNLRLLETLSVFGVRASYMARFRESLQNEGIVTEVEEIEIPIRIAEPFLKRGLQVLKLQGAFAEPVPLRVESGIRINLDLRPRVEAATGGFAEYVAEDAAGTEQTIHLRKFASILDWNRITQRCMLFRRDKGESLQNLAFDAARLREVFEEASIVIQSTPEYFAGNKFSALARMEDTVVTALCKYMAVFHERRRKEWETKNLRLEPLAETDGNLSFGKYVVKVSTDKPSAAQKIAAIVADAKAAASTASLYNRDLEDADGLRTTYIDCHLYQPLLRGWKDELENIKPAGLEESEIDFVRDLREYLTAHSEVLNGGELFLLRNQVTYGVVCYDETGSGFYPDFLLWILGKDGAQTLCFVDLHGIGWEALMGAKIQLWRRLREEIAPNLPPSSTGCPVRLDAFLLAPTYATDSTFPIIQDARDEPEKLEANHVLFQ